MPLHGYIYGLDKATKELRVLGPFTSQRSLRNSAGYLIGELRVDLSTPNQVKAKEEIEAAIRTGALKDPAMETGQENFIKDFGGGEQNSGRSESVPSEGSVTSEPKQDSGGLVGKVKRVFRRPKKVDTSTTEGTAWSEPSDSVWSRTNSNGN